MSAWDRVHGKTLKVAAERGIVVVDWWFGAVELPASRIDGLECIAGLWFAGLLAEAAQKMTAVGT